MPPEAATDAAGAAAEAAAGAPAYVVLHGVAFGHRHGLGRADIGQRQDGVGFQLLGLDAADQAADATADQAADGARHRGPADIAVAALDLGDQHVVGLDRLGVAAGDRLEAQLHALGRGDGAADLGAQLELEALLGQVKTIFKKDFQLK